MSGGLERSCATKSKSTVCTYRLRPKRSVWRHSPGSAEQILPSVGPQRPCILWQVSCIRQKQRNLLSSRWLCRGLHDPAPRIRSSVHWKSHKHPHATTHRKRVRNSHRALAKILLSISLTPLSVPEARCRSPKLPGPVLILFPTAVQLERT